MTCNHSLCYSQLVSHIHIKKQIPIESKLTTYSISGIEVQGGHCKLNTKADNADCTMSMTATFTGAVTSTTSATTMSFLDVQSPVTVTAGLDKLKAAPGASATDASTTAPASTGAGSSSTGSAQTTLAKHTSTGTQTASSTSKPTSTNAAGIVNTHNGLLAGVAAFVGGVMML